jgi:hypothetical protein
VSDAQDNPIAGAWVSADPYDGSGTWGSVETNADGTYTIAGLSADSYRVYAYATGYLTEYYDNERDWSMATSVAVSEGQDTPDINLSLDVGGTISGTITDGQGNPIEDAWVSADPYDGSGTWGSAETSADGTYTISPPLRLHSVRHGQGLLPSGFR